MRRHARLNDRKEQCQSQWPMHQKIAVPLHITSIGLVQMDTMRIERKGREAEEQGLGRGNCMFEFRVRRSFSREEAKESA